MWTSNMRGIYTALSCFEKTHYVLYTNYRTRIFALGQAENPYLCIISFYNVIENHFGIVIITFCEVYVSASVLGAIL